MDIFSPANLMNPLNPLSPLWVGHQPDHRATADAIAISGGMGEVLGVIIFVVAMAALVTWVITR